MEFFNWKQPHGANKYPQYTAVYSKYTAVYSRVYGRILRYWSLEYTAVYPKSPKWGSFKHNIDHHNWQTRGIPQPTYACIVHYTFVPTCTCHIPLSPKAPFFTRILPGIPGMPGYAHHIPALSGSLFAVLRRGTSEITPNITNVRFRHTDGPLVIRSSVPCSGYCHVSPVACPVTPPVTLSAFLFSVFKKDVHPRYLCVWVNKASPKELLLQNCLGYDVDNHEVEAIA